MYLIYPHCGTHDIPLFFRQRNEWKAQMPATKSKLCQRSLYGYGIDLTEHRRRERVYSAPEGQRLVILAAEEKPAKLVHFLRDNV